MSRCACDVSQEADSRTQRTGTYDPKSRSFNAIHKLRAVHRDIGWLSIPLLHILVSSLQARLTRCAINL